MIKIEINGKDIDLKKCLKDAARKAIDKSVQVIDQLQNYVEDLSVYTDDSEETDVVDFQDNPVQNEYPYGVNDDEFVTDDNTEDIKEQMHFDEKNPEEENDEEDLMRIIYPTTDENGNKLSFEEFLDSIIGEGEISNPEDFFIELVTHVNHCETLDACSLSKNLVNINYNTVISELKLYYKYLSKIQIRNHLDEDFEYFVRKYPHIREAYPKANMMSLIRYYKKNCKF